MKTLVLFLVWMMSSLALLSQDIPEPEFTDRPYFLKENALVSFERVDGNLGANTSMKGMETFYTATAAKSTIRFSSGAIPKIVIKTEGTGDPSESISVVRATVAKDKRNFIVRKSDKKNNALDISEFQQKVTFKKVRDNLFEITFDTAPAKGEFSVIKGNGTDLKLKLSCFGID